VGPAQRLYGDVGREVIDSVAAVEREEVDEIEAQLSSELEVDTPADVPST
jgi:hypothetical protein